MPRSGKSIIQKTLIKVSLAIFAFNVILAAIVGQNFLEREFLKTDALLYENTALVQNRIQAQVEIIEQIKDIYDSGPELLEELLVFVQDNIASSHTNLGSFGYFDIDLGVFIGEQGIERDVSWIYEANANRVSILNIFKMLYSGQSAGNTDRIVAMLPVYYNHSLVGYAIGYTSSFAVFLNSTGQVSMVLVLVLILAASVIVLIRKFIKELRQKLDEFTAGIINNRYDAQMAESLPELAPVIGKIKSFTENLVEINSELERSKLKLTKILDGISDGFFSVDRQWRFTFINEGMYSLYAWEPETARPRLRKVIWDECPDLNDKKNADKLIQAMNLNEPLHWEAESVCHPERYYEYQVYPFDEGLTVIVRDITETHRQRQEIMRLERLNLIGQMAAGISHEIRNPLTTVKGFLQLLSSREQYRQDKEHIRLMISEIDRANGIISDFLSLGKVGLSNLKPQNLNEVIVQIYPMLQADALSQDKEIVLDLKKIPDIMINTGEIIQLILNLVRNALEVTPEKGVVTIGTSVSGNRVVLSVADQGPGIPEEIRDRIGTPFFTTKDNGTGLGLAISNGIAQRHDALLDFETSSQGTTFKVKFQLCAGSNEFHSTAANNGLQLGAASVESSH